MKEGLKLLRTLGYSNVVIETDCLEAVAAVNAINHEGSVMELHIDLLQLLMRIDLLQLLMRIDLLLSGVDNLQIAFWMCCNSIVTPLFKQTS
ncbi:hypothetical protein ACLB2K_029923 [Fragaria x ananassa]